MGLEWLGEYREFIGELMRFGNAYARGSRAEHSYNTPVKFTPSEVHVLEYILEHEEHFENMAAVADILGITKGALSKSVKKMEQKGLIEKFHTADNKKNIIIRVTDFGRDVYRTYTEFAYSAGFEQLFALLDGIPTEYVQRFTEVLCMAAELSGKEKEPPAAPKLIKIQKDT